MSSNKYDQLNELDRQLAQTDDPLAVAGIYLNAAMMHAESANIDEACFFMTQAFVFASYHGDKSIEKTARNFLQKHDRI